uniref:Uncharacterized protein n=1 Tax=Manihot esculenta TaxID=3983 RepID=A0A2C9V513_MANES
MIADKWQTFACERTLLSIKERLRAKDKHRAIKGSLSSGTSCSSMMNPLLI